LATRQDFGPTENQEEPVKSAKSSDISKHLVWEANRDLKTRGDAAGIDKESIDVFVVNLKDNLYRLWNRRSSGSYFPPSVRAVPIPKKTGGTWILGVPTVSDRIAQSVVKRVLEAILDQIFDQDQFGYRAGKSAHDAIAKTRQRCWFHDWVVEFDIHPEKSRMVYCKDRNSSEEHDVINFDFLGFMLRPQRCLSESHCIHANFLPAISRSSRKDINREICRRHIQLKNDKTLDDLSNMFKAKIRGWIAYYGRFYPTEIGWIWKNINGYLIRCVRRKYKRFASHKKQARCYLRQLAQGNQRLFIHWELGCCHMA